MDVSDCDVIDRHCSIRIDIDPNDPTIMYMTTGGHNVVQKLKITDTELKPMLADMKGEFNSFPTLSDESAHFKTYEYTSHYTCLDNG